jgi:hypothetical protein
MPTINIDVDVCFHIQVDEGKNLDVFQGAFERRSPGICAGS